MSAPRDPAIDAFIEKAINYTVDDCLIWPFGIADNGYATLDRLKGKYGTRIVSRAICLEVHGPPLTPKLDAAHSKKCISKACINPKHLRWATHVDNLADDRRGEDNSRAILTEEQVLEIKKLLKIGQISQTKIASRYNVARVTISHIVSNKNWKWLEEPSNAELLFDTTRPRMKDLFK